MHEMASGVAVTGENLLDVLPSSKTVERPWGYFRQYAHNEECTVKTLVVSAGHRLSLQRHQLRSEFWEVLRGSGTAQVGDTIYELKPGDAVFIPKTAPHRLTAGPNGITVLEVAFGHFDETGDEERLEDDYGRGSPE